MRAITHTLVTPTTKDEMHHSVHKALLQKLQDIHWNDAENVSATISPCISVCRLDDSQQYCIGCLRTLQELSDWGTADAAAKRIIWQRIRDRSQKDCP